MSARSVPAMDLAGPPVEAARRADEVLLTLECDATLGLRVLQLLDAGEVPMDPCGVRQRPQMFGWLQLRGIWRQNEQVGMLGHPQSRTVMPAPAPNCSHQGGLNQRKRASDERDAPLNTGREQKDAVSAEVSLPNRL